MPRYCPQCVERLPSNAHPAKVYCSIRCRDRAERARSKSRETATRTAHESGLRGFYFAHVSAPSVETLAKLEQEMLLQDKPMLIENPPSGWIPLRTSEVVRNADGTFTVSRWIPSVSEALAGITENAAPGFVVEPINPITNRPFDVPKLPGGGLPPRPKDGPKGGLL